ncbi:MAG: hypothetical protein AAF627_05945 [Myxococcota bacterium]
MTAIVPRVGYGPHEVSDARLSSPVASVLEGHGVSTEPHVELFDCAELRDVLHGLVGPGCVHEHSDSGSVASAVRAHRVTVVVTHARGISELMRNLSVESAPVGLIVYDPNGHDSNSAALRAQGVMDVLTDRLPETWADVLTRAFDFRALLMLELDHRCESKRLSQRELELLGEPPESLSDDLDSFQPPPLPVGPMSVHDLESASDAFETAYIERVQHLCNSAREAAQVLGVSPATLSRRQRRDIE